MMIKTTAEYDAWFLGLSEEETKLVAHKLDVLEQGGVTLGYPHSSQVTRKIRELRVTSVRHPIRIFYAFDPRRNAVLLLAATKKGAHDESKWTREMGERAEVVFDVYLASQAADEKRLAQIAPAVFAWYVAGRVGAQPAVPPYLAAAVAALLGRL